MCRIGEEDIDSSNALLATSAVSNAAGGKTRGGKIGSIIPRNWVDCITNGLHGVLFIVDNIGN